MSYIQTVFPLTGEIIDRTDSAVRAYPVDARDFIVYAAEKKIPLTSSFDEIDGDDDNERVSANFRAVLHVNWDDETEGMTDDESQEFDWEGASWSDAEISIECLTGRFPHPNEPRWENIIAYPTFAAGSKSCNEHVRIQDALRQYLHEHVSATEDL